MKTQRFAMKVGRTVQIKTRAEVAKLLRIGRANRDTMLRLPPSCPVERP